MELKTTFMRFRHKIKSASQVIKGKRNKTRGEQFENLLKSHAGIDGWLAIRIPDGAKQISHTQIIRVFSPFDFVFLKNKAAIFCDAKTTTAKTFAKSTINPKQAQWLESVSKKGFHAGYVIYFETLGSVSFFPSQMLTAPGRGSLKPEDGISIGTRQVIELDKILETPIP